MYGINMIIHPYFKRGQGVISGISFQKSFLQAPQGPVRIHHLEGLLKFLLCLNMELYFSLYHGVDARERPSQNGFFVPTVGFFVSVFFHFFSNKIVYKLKELASLLSLHQLHSNYI